MDPKDGIWNIGDSEDQGSSSGRLYTADSSLCPYFPDNKWKYYWSESETEDLDDRINVFEWSVGMNNANHPFRNCHLTYKLRLIVGFQITVQRKA